MDGTVRFIQVRSVTGVWKGIWFFFYVSYVIIRVNDIFFILFRVFFLYVQFLFFLEVCDIPFYKGIRYFCSLFRMCFFLSICFILFYR